MLISHSECSANAFLCMYTLYSWATFKRCFLFAFRATYMCKHVCFFLHLCAQFKENAKLIEWAVLSWEHWIEIEKKTIINCSGIICIYIVGPEEQTTFTNCQEYDPKWARKRDAAIVSSMHVMFSAVMILTIFHCIHK